MQSELENRLNQLDVMEENCKNRFEKIQNDFDENTSNFNIRSENLKKEFSIVQNELKNSLEDITQKASTSVEEAKNSVQYIQTQCDNE